MSVHTATWRQSILQSHNDLRGSCCVVLSGIGTDFVRGKSTPPNLCSFLLQLHRRCVSHGLHGRPDCAHAEHVAAVPRGHCSLFGLNFSNGALLIDSKAAASM